MSDIDRKVSTRGSSAPGIGGRIGLRARAENELVVGDLLLGAVSRAANGDLLAIAVDRRRLGPRPHVDPQVGIQHRGCLHEQPLSVGDSPADVIRQPAVGERDVFPALDKYDLRVF